VCEVRGRSVDELDRVYGGRIARATNSELDGAGSLDASLGSLQGLSGGDRAGERG